jgi:hypothetical protein
MTKTIGQLNKGVNKRTLAGPRRAAGQFEPGTKIGSGESLGAQTGKGNYSGQTSIAPEVKPISPPEADDLNIDPTSVEEAQPTGPTSFERHLAAYRQQLSELSPSMTTEEIDAWVAKVKAGFGNSGFDRPAVFQGAPEKLRDSSGEIVETVLHAGGDMQRALSSLRQQVEDADSAFHMATTVAAKKKAKVALQTAQRLLKNALDESTLSARLTIEKSVRKYLGSAKAKGWVTDYNEDDVEDIISDAWLEQHSEEAILQCLQKAGLERTHENIECAHHMLTEELNSSPKVSALGARRAAERWKENRRQRKEISLEKPVHVSENGDELLLKEALQQPEEDLRGYIPSEVSQKFKAEQVLTPKELKWLADYEAAREPKGKRGAKRSKKPRTAAERQRAQRLRKKAKRKLEKIL